MKKILSNLKTIGLVLYRRAVPALTLAILFGIVAVLFDKWRISEAPASDFINYTAFDVNNARAGEDVYFKVCRDHKENYVYAGALTVYIYKDTDPNATPTKVYAKDIGGSIRTECENKVLRASEFQHTPGTYKMAFCINFNVKYHIEKTACRDSNIYKIYPQPTDIKHQLQYYQNQIDILNQQLKDRGVSTDADNTGQSSIDMADSSQSTPTTSTQPAPSSSPPASPNNPPPPPPPSTSQQPQQCGVTFGIGLLCGNDGLIRL